jgi:agmatinase
MAIAVVGVPFDEYSSFQRGPAAAPQEIRAALRTPSSNLCAENGLDLGNDDRWNDAGDLDLPTGDAAFEAIESSVALFLERNARVVCLGGDHSITYPVVLAHSKIHGRLNLLHLDAHPDLYDTFEANRLSHACPFARILEEDLVTRVVQVGIRTSNPHQREQAHRFGVETIEMQEWNAGVVPAFGGPVYLSIDLDCLDPAFAPGVSHPEPGGLTTRDVIEIVQRVDAPIVGADIVELNPDRDPSGITAMVAAKILKEVLARMLDRERVEGA